MFFNAKIELNPIQIKEIICDYLQQMGIKVVSHQNIHFNIKEIEREHPVLQGITIDNVQIGGRGKFE